MVSKLCGGAFLVIKDRATLDRDRYHHARHIIRFTSPLLHT